MKCKNNKLLVTSRPAKGESFLGFILRLSELNHYSSLKKLLIYTGLYNKGVKSLTTFNNESFQILGKVTGVSPEELANMAFIIEGKQSYVRYGDQVLPSSYITPHKPKICPKCLSQQGYCKKEWELSFVTACPEHKCTLISECPCCGKKISWNRSAISKCMCGYDLTKATLKNLAEDEVELPRQIDALLEGKAFGENGLAYFDNIEAFIETMYILSGEFQRFHERSKKIDKISPYEYHCYLNKGFEVLTDWPVNFLKLLDGKLKSQRVRSRENLIRVFGELYQFITRHLSDPQYEFFRNTFENHLNSFIDAPQLLINQEVINPDRYVSRTEARRILNCGVSTVNKLVKTGELDAIRIYGREARHILVSIESIERQKKIRQRQMENKANTEADNFSRKKYSNISLISKQLGLSKKYVVYLAENGVLNIVNNPNSGNYPYWLFTKDAVKEMVDTIRARIPQTYEISEPLLTFTEATEKLKFNGVDKIMFIKMVFGGEVNPVTELTEKRGLDGLCFLKSAICSITDKVYKSKTDGLISVRETAKILKAKEHDIRTWTNVGLLPVPIWISGRKVYKINDIKEFEKNYVFATFIAENNKLSVIKLMEMLSSENILPVSGRKIDGGIRYVYNRKDLQETKKVTVNV